MKLLKISYRHSRFSENTHPIIYPYLQIVLRGDFCGLKSYTQLTYLVKIDYIFIILSQYTYYIITKILFIKKTSRPNIISTINKKIQFCNLIKCTYR